MNDKKFAQQLIALIDHTNLDANATAADINTLCEQAITPQSNPAAICIYPQFIPQAKTKLHQTKVRIATVCNFPSGNADLPLTLDEITQAIQHGADEIDVVMPYVAFAQGQHSYVSHYLSRCRAACGDNIILKVILETGYLITAELIMHASALAIASGADFIKTSTGKIKPGATLEAVAAMIKVVATEKAGIKVSGGIQTMAQIKPFYELLVTSFGSDWISPNNFRIGSSSLLTNLKQVAYF